MPSPAPPRFQVRTLLDAAARGEPPFDQPVAVEEVARIGAWFRSEAAALVGALPADVVPLRLPKDRIAAVLSCEAGTLAGLGTDGADMSEALVMGRLADLLVAQHVTTGLTGDVEGDLRDALAARADAEVSAWLDAAGPDTRAQVWERAEGLARSLAGSWGPVDPSWWPRPQERVVVPVADGALVLSAVFDLALGGPGTDRPWIVVEVKSGRATDRHRADVLWYALVASLRHRRAPAMVATWTGTDDALLPLAVTAGGLEAAAERGLAALGRLAELAVGRVPSITPHLGCRWCARFDRCDAGIAYVDRIGRGDDPWERGGPDGDGYGDGYGDGDDDE